MGKWFDRKRRFFLLLFFAAALGLMGTIFVDSGVSVPANIDLSLESELAQASDVLENFGTDAVQTSPQSGAGLSVEEYVPAGAEYASVQVGGDVVYMDYQLRNVRYLVAYYPDGSVEKVAREIDGDRVYSIDSIHHCIAYQDVT